MDLPPALETVYQAVYSLYNNPNTSENKKASQWLDELQRSIYAWKIADEMLHEKRDLQACYFAAQTMRTKIQQSFHELPAEAHSSLRDSLMDHISQINEHTDTAIVTQLCLALAGLTLQMSSWHKPIVDLMNRFGGTSTGLWPLLEVMTVLPEEVDSRFLRLGANRRQYVLMDLNASANIVTEFLKICLENSDDKSQIRVRILRCFTSWIMVNAIPLEAIPTSSIVAHAFQVLGNHMSVSQLHEAATDCVCMILRALRKNNNYNCGHNDSDLIVQLQQLQLRLFTHVMALEQPYHLSVAHEDLEKSINYCRIFTELAESFLETMVTGSEGGKQHYSVKILDLVLTCVGHHDYEVAEITFNLWFRLSEHLYNRNMEELNAIFRPYIERLIGALCRHCQMEPDHQGLVEEGSGGEEFADFRVRVSELIRDVVFVVGSSHCFREMFSMLTGSPGSQGQPAQSPTWDLSEAALFVMQSVAKNILPEKNDVVPKVVEAILNLPENTHIAVRHTSILLLGELCEWIEKHPQVLEPVLNFLLACLGQRGLGGAASGALQSICVACPRHMAAHFPGLLQIARSLDSFAISNGAAIGLLKGVSMILARLPQNEIGPAMKELCWFQARPLCELMEARIPIERGTKTDPVLWLDRLAVIFRHTNPRIENPNEPHPCQSVITEMWPVLSNACTTYQHDARLMERCCRCLKFAVRCVGKHSAHLLEPLVKQIVELYAAHQHSCCLYLGSILVDEYAGDVECVNGLLRMLEAFVQPAFTILQHADGLQNHPDTVDDLFRLCARFLQKAPVAFLHSAAVSSIVECALLSCSLDHRDANASVMKFFYDLLHCGRNHENQMDLAIKQQLVQEIVREKGQALVARLLHASVFSLQPYMLSDVADVIVELNLFDKELVSKWFEEAIKAMPAQNAGGSPTATPEQLLEFHNTVTRADTSKSVTHALRNFARLFH